MSIEIDNNSWGNSDELTRESQQSHLTTGIANFTQEAALGDIGLVKTLYLTVENLLEILTSSLT